MIHPPTVHCKKIDLNSKDANLKSAKKHGAFYVAFLSALLLSIRNLVTDLEGQLFRWREQNR